MENKMNSSANRGTEYNNWEMSGDGTKVNNATQERARPTLQKKGSGNSAAKAASHAQSAVSNTNPNIRTGLSDDMNNTGTNVAYTEKES